MRDQPIRLAGPIAMTFWARRVRVVRVGIMVIVGLSLLVALWVGLIRIGWSLPIPQTGLLLAHGPLMVCGMLMTVVSLERAVALGRIWSYIAPVLGAVGAISLVVGAPPAVAMLAILISSALLVAAYAIIVRRQAAIFTWTMALGAVLLLSGNILWLTGWPVFRVVPWWMGFLVLSIAGERLELSRVQRLPSSALRMFVMAAALMTVGIVGTTIWPDAGTRVMGIGAGALAIWLLNHDIARRTIKAHGLPRYIAICLLGGHIWLALGGMLAMIFGFSSSGFLYDATLHTVFVGFVISMIFGHMLIILPAVIGVMVAPLKHFYVPLVLLHVSLIMRVTGDVFAQSDLRRWGGLLNVTALLAYFALLVYATRIANRVTHATNQPLENSSHHENLSPA